jgi:hypothetical protein
VEVADKVAFTCWNPLKARGPGQTANFRAAFFFLKRRPRPQFHWRRRRQGHTMVAMWRCVGTFLPAVVWALAADPASVAELQRGFAQPPDDARMMVRWWWFGPAVTKAELEREMRLMKEGGIGGFEVQATYPLQLEGNLRYLSPGFLEMLRFTGEKAKELGLRLDLTLGSGWPYGGPHIPLDLAAGRLRTAPGGTPALLDGERVIATGDGKAIIASHTRQTVKRPAFGAEGWVLDHYNRAALEAHLKAVGEPLLKALEKTPPYAIFSDSLEVYGADWTPDFLREFQTRRGYDLLPLLPALAGDLGEKTGAVRHDWGLTLSELADENYLKPLTVWAKAHGTKFRSQTYGIPPVTLSSNALVDLPEGEGHQWRKFSTTRWASSAGHLYGRPVISSETWTWLDSPVFRATPLDMKAEADIHFLQGINQLVGHGWPYSPPEAGEPGWRFYAAAVFNQHNPWWTVMPDITKYLERLSWMLRQGTPVNDVAVYLPTHDAFAGFTVQAARPSVNQAMEALIGPNVVPAILDAGYGFDFIDDGAIAAKGINYKILVVPNVERIPLATYRRISEFRGTVIFTKRLPSKAPGLKEESETAQIQELSAKYSLTDEVRLIEALHAAVPPDLTAPPEIGMVHRKLPFAEIYFLANTSNHPVNQIVRLRSCLREAIWLDPSSGRPVEADYNVGWAPYESRVLVCSGFSARPAPPGSDMAPMDLSRDWKVTFADSKEPLTMAALRSWTDDEARKFYSGTATYEKTFSLSTAPAQAWLDFGQGTPVDPNAGRRPANGMRALLESPVREAAQVWINGRPAGAVWKPPYRVEVSGLLKPGDNTVRIVVANLALNGLATAPLPDYKELTAKFGERFQAQDMQSVQALPSGILGPVRLVGR